MKNIRKNDYGSFHSGNVAPSM